MLCCRSGLVGDYEVWGKMLQNHNGKALEIQIRILNLDYFCNLLAKKKPGELITSHFLFLQTYLM